MFPNRKAPGHRQATVLVPRCASRPLLRLRWLALACALALVALNDAQAKAPPGHIGLVASFGDAHEAALASLSLSFRTGSPGVGGSLRERRFAAIEPEPQLPVAGRADAGPRHSRQQLRLLTIMYLDPVAPQETISARASLGGGDIIEASPAGAGAPVLTPAIVEAFGEPFEARGVDEEIMARSGAPVVAVRAREPAYWGLGLGVTIEVGNLWRRAKTFLAEARNRARPRGQPLVLPPMAQWRPRVETFVLEAQAKARAGVTRSGPLYELYADLKSKAQAGRD